MINFRSQKSIKKQGGSTWTVDRSRLPNGVVTCHAATPLGFSKKNTKPLEAAVEQPWICEGSQFQCPEKMCHLLNHKWYDLILFERKPKRWDWMIQDSQLWNGFAIFCHNFKLFPPNHKVTWFLPENPTSGNNSPQRNMNPTSLWRSGWAMVFFQIWLPYPPPKKKDGNLKESSVCLGCQSPLPGWKKGPKGCSYTTSRDLKLKRLIFHDCILSVFFLTVFFAKQDCSAPHVYQVCSKFSLINSKTLRNFRSWGSCFFPSRRLKNFFNTEFNTFTVDYHWIRREHAEKKSYPGFKTRGSFFVPYFEWKIFLWPLL